MRLREAPTGMKAVSGGRYLVFGLGPASVALSIEHVRELVRPPALTRVPGAPVALAGLANLRGVPLPVLDLRRLLGPDEAQIPAAARMIVADAGETVGLLINRIDGLDIGTPCIDEDAPDIAPESQDQRARVGNLSSHISVQGSLVARLTHVHISISTPSHQLFKEEPAE